jgi:hypothetical protein
VNVRCRCLLELFSEGGKLCLQIGDLAAQVRDFGGEGFDAFVGWSRHGVIVACCNCMRRSGRYNWWRVAQKMCAAGFLRAWLPRQDRHQRRIALFQAAQSGMYALQVFKSVHPRSVRSQFTGSLRPTQQQLAEDGDLRPVKIENVLKTVLEFGNAAVCGADRSHQRLIFEMVESFSDFAFFQLHSGMAIRFLIAGVGESVQRKRIIFRRGDFFFDQGAQNASFDGCQCKLHGFGLVEPAYFTSE